jgi:hypothetical protein
MRKMIKGIQMAFCLRAVAFSLLIAGSVVAISGHATELVRAGTREAEGLVVANEAAGDGPQQPADEKRKKIRKENDKKAGAREPFYPLQALSLARHYKETAAIVSRQGGNPQPLLDAAAYFENQSR